MHEPPPVGNRTQETNEKVIKIFGSDLAFRISERLRRTNSSAYPNPHDSANQYVDPG